MSSLFLSIQNSYYWLYSGTSNFPHVSFIQRQKIMCGSKIQYLNKTLALRSSSGTLQHGLCSHTRSSLVLSHSASLVESILSLILTASLCAEFFKGQSCLKYCFLKILFIFIGKYYQWGTVTSEVCSCWPLECCPFKWLVNVSQNKFSSFQLFVFVR